MVSAPIRRDNGSRFYELTRNHFVFLQRYGYTCLQENYEGSVSFIGKSNQINIFFSIVEYELTCQFIDETGNFFTLQDALGYVEIREYKGLYQISRREEIEKGILYLADVIKSLLYIKKNAKKCVINDE